MRKVSNKQQIGFLGTDKKRKKKSVYLKLKDNRWAIRQLIIAP